MAKATKQDAVPGIKRLSNLASDNLLSIGFTSDNFAGSSSYESSIGESRGFSAGRVPAYELIASGQLSFRQWLDISWFYPQGFDLEGIRETRDAWLVLGSSVVYKFFKVGAELSDIDSRTGVDLGVESGEEPSSGFVHSWRRICQEIKECRASAPGLYLGVRLLRWVNDEPEWVSEALPDNLEGSKPPNSVDHAALVMRRISEFSRFDSVLSRISWVPAAKCDRLARSLLKFHATECSASASRQSTKAVRIVDSFEERHIKQAELLMQEVSQYVDPFTRAAAYELHRIVSSGFSSLRGELIRRAGLGLLSAAHGALVPEVIAFPRQSQSLDAWFLERPLKKDRGRNEDVLVDLASIVIELEVRGYRLAAARICERYVTKAGRLFSPALYRLLLASISVSRAASCFADDSDSLELMPQYLRRGLCYALNLDQPSVVGIDINPEAEEDPQSYALAQAIGELVPAELLGSDPAKRSSDCECLNDFNEMFRKARWSEEPREVTVVLYPFNREDDRDRFFRAAHKNSLKGVLVLGKSRRNHSHISSIPISSRESDFSASQIEKVSRAAKVTNFHGTTSFTTASVFNAGSSRSLERRPFNNVFQSQSQQRIVLVDESQPVAERAIAVLRTIN